MVDRYTCHGIRFGAGYGSVDCFRFQTGWVGRNFLGGARSLDVSARVSKVGVGYPLNAGFKDKTVVSIIAARPAAYDLSPDRMIELKRHGVSEKIIVAMLARQQPYSSILFKRYDGLSYDDIVWKLVRPGPADAFRDDV